MKGILIAAALAAAAVPQAFNPASAQPDAAKQQLLMTLERLASPRVTPNAPLVTRSSSISVTGKVQIISPEIVGPLFCRVSFGYFDPDTSEIHLETKTNRIAISGKIGTCSVSVPFKWQNVADFLDVPISIDVGNTLGGSPAEATVAQPSRTSRFDGPTLPLPLEGETLRITFDARI